MLAAIKKHYIGKALSTPCPTRIPRTGKRGEEINCIEVTIDHPNGDPCFAILSLESDMLHALEWGGDRYSTPKEIPTAQADWNNVRVTHYYGLSTINYGGIYQYAFGHLTKWPFIYLGYMHFVGKVNQGIFNRRKMIAASRTELLQIIIENYGATQEPFSAFDLMTDLHSERWIDHPGQASQIQMVELHLESLVESGELAKASDGYNFQVCPKAIPSLERYQSENSRHAEGLRVQKLIFRLTVIISIFTAAQANLIKFPTLVDFTSLNLSWAGITGGSRGQ